jgi:prepilin-type N-terminal cleavage/methylation domain-containing protein
MKGVLRDQRGLTLIEMLVVLFIIGVIVAIALPNLKAAGEAAQEKACSANRRLIGAQADNFFLEIGRYPKDVPELQRKGFLRTQPTCPTKGSYRIRPEASEEKRVTCTVHGDG